MMENVPLLIIYTLVCNCARASAKSMRLMRCRFELFFVFVTFGEIAPFFVELLFYVSDLFFVAAYLPCLCVNKFPFMLDVIFQKIVSCQ